MKNLIFKLNNKEKQDFEIIWMGQCDLFYKGISKFLMDKYWQFFLLNDGSITKQLQIISKSKIHVMNLNELPFKLTPDFNKHLKKYISEPLIERKIYLYTKQNEPLMYAISWWSTKNINSIFLNPSEPIWSNLAQLKIEFYRELKKLLLINSHELELKFQQKGPFWGRYYLIWYQNKPLTIILEIFSPKINTLINFNIRNIKF
uniref:Ycf21 n=1 Tax=Cyanophora sudae TaxID=1522369 RepID=A0A2Z4HG93_9EUKA|nr:hypothetical protein [Cyanophora sudae]AWW13651.1 hypothetical protein [Cyanophora sudae]